MVYIYVCIYTARRSGTFYWTNTMRDKVMRERASERAKEKKKTPKFVVFNTLMC